MRVGLIFMLGLLSAVLLVACDDEPGEPHSGADTGPEGCLGDSQCDDGVYCNGAEQCEPPTRGQQTVSDWGMPQCGPQPVGSLAQNDFGLYDMLGNVAELCGDMHVPDPGAAAVTDPYFEGPADMRNLRGGAYFREANRIRAAYRGGVNHWVPRATHGFRVVRTLP